MITNSIDLIYLLIAIIAGFLIIDGLVSILKKSRQGYFPFISGVFLLIILILLNSGAK